MPELPEVETMRLYISKQSKGKILQKIEVLNPSLREYVNLVEVKKIKNLKIFDILRHGKYLIFILENEKIIVMHSGMSGSFAINKENTHKKHDHIIFYLDDGLKIKYNDPRRFGIFMIDNKKNITKNKFLQKLGTDALAINFEEFFKNLQIQKEIKPALLEQKIIAGIGNIYASEILFASKILPTRKSCELNQNEVNEILKNTKKILQKSIEKGGSTIKDHKKPDGQIGYFQLLLNVYGREKKTCKQKDCQSKIIKVIQNTRATFFCPTCQK